MPLPFSKKSLKNRLLNEGRWSDFMNRREQLKSDGCKPDEAWLQAAAEYPPLEPGESPEPIPASKLEPSTPPKRPAPASPLGRQMVPARTFKGKSCSIREVLEWVAEHILVQDVKAKDAPSATAWAMLGFVRHSQNFQLEFWKNMYVRLLPSRAVLETEERFTDDGRKAFSVIDRLEAGSQEGDDTPDKG